jgi:hypothetical protein
MSKAFLQGFSIGMLLTTALLTIAIYTLGDSLKSTEQGITGGAVETYLIESGQTVISSEEYNSLISLKEQNQELTNELELAQKETTEPEQTEDQNEKGLFEVEQGMTVQEIGQKLEEMNIIKNRHELTAFLSEKGWEGSIQLGAFELSNTMSIEEIARIITKNP